MIRAYLGHLSRRWRKRFSGLLNRSWAERAALIEAWLFLAFSRLCLPIVPLRFLCPELGLSSAGSSGVSVERTALERVRWAIDGATHVAFWRCRCLNRALAANWMLKRRGISSILCLGVANHDDRFLAHAWLKVGDRILTGGEEHGDYRLVSKES